MDRAPRPLQPGDHRRRISRRRVHGRVPVREAGDRPGGARPPPEGAVAAPASVCERDRLDVVGTLDDRLLPARHFPERAGRRDARARPFRGDRAVPRRPSPPVSLRLGQHPETRARTRALPGRDGARSGRNPARARVLAAGARGSGRGRRDPDPLPGSDRGEEAREQRAVQRTARGGRRARRRNRPRDPEPARVDFRVRSGAVERADGGLDRETTDGDHRLGVEPPFRDPGGVPPLRAAAGASRGTLRRGHDGDRGDGHLPPFRRSLRRARDRGGRHARLFEPVRRSRPDPPDRLQRRQECGPRDGGRGHAHRHRTRG